MDVIDIVESVDILEYISQFCEFEERNGEHWALSPLKDENTPSFSVDAEKGCFYDFSSGIGGNVLTFIEKYNKCSFGEAVRILKEYANISDDGVSARLTATKVMRKFKKPRIDKKIVNMPVLQPNYLEAFEYDKTKMQEWIDEGISEDVLVKHSVLYDAFSNRLIYPIYNLDGELINVSGRTLDPDYKKKKIRKYTYYKPLGDLNTLYWLSQNREEILKKKEVILFEGAKSVMKAETWGVTNTAAILTSHLNPLQLRILIRLGVRVVFALDEDVDIREDGNIKKLKRFVKVEYISGKGVLQDKMSPVDLGEEVFRELYKEREWYK